MNNENLENLDSVTTDVSGDDNVNDTSSENVDNSDNTDNDLEAELEKVRKIAEDQKRRAEKAEKMLKSIKKPEPQAETKSEGQETRQQDQLTKEEAILYAKGFSQEEVEKVKSIARIEGENPLITAESELFKLWKERQDAKKKAEETQLGVSRGSAKIKPKKDFSSSDLSSEEHKALWRQAMGR